MDRQYLRWEVKNPRMRMNGGVRTSVHLVTQRPRLVGGTYLWGFMLSMAALRASQTTSTFFPLGSLDSWTVLATGGGYMVFVTSSSLRTSS